ncbi:MAG: exodeoxyribonuclease VII small subunit [Chloroflexota bacterium]|nr:exodeoxyribonuclease VII small subunit [Chloroflexota bacterium]
MTETPTPASRSEASARSADISALPFDKALDELKDVVARLEEGSLPLEESIALYERGAALHEHCGKLLDAAELRVQRLVDGAGGESPRAMDLRPDDGDDL